MATLPTRCLVIRYPRADFYGSDLVMLQPIHSDWEKLVSNKSWSSKSWFLTASQASPKCLRSHEKLGPGSSSSAEFFYCK